MEIQKNKLSGPKGIAQSGTTQLPLLNLTSLRHIRFIKESLVNRVARAVSCKRTCTRHANIIDGVQQSGRSDVQKTFSLAIKYC